MSKSRIPWNLGRKLGQKKPFTFDQIQSLTRLLEDKKRYRDLCLFCLGIDTSLRGGDLVRLKVSQVMDELGCPKKELQAIQQKTGQGAVAAITPYTQSAVNCFVVEAGLKSNDYLFTGRTGDRQKPLSTNYLRRLVKSWAEMLGLNPADYSSHSLRRSKVSYLYARGVRPEMLRYLLGHASIQSTQEYLGLDRNQALDLARKFDCFGER